MNIHKVNPFIRLAQHHTIDNWNIEPRIILDYELLYCCGGHCTLDYDNQAYTISKDDIVLICPGVEHAFRDTSNFVQPHIHFDLAYDEKDSEMVFICFCREKYLSPAERNLIRTNVFYQNHHSPIITIDNTNLFSHLFFEIIDSFKTDYTIARSDMLRLIEMIEHSNFPGTFHQNHPKSKLCDSVKHFIDKNITRPLSLQELEFNFCYDRFYISKEFKKEFGSSIMSYHKSKRLQLSFELLKSYTVTEVSEMLGFSSVFAFSRAFKNYFGTSPKDLSS